MGNCNTLQKRLKLFDDLRTRYSRYYIFFTSCVLPLHLVRKDRLPDHDAASFHLLLAHVVDYFRSELPPSVILCCAQLWMDCAHGDPVEERPVAKALGREQSVDSPATPMPREGIRSKRGTFLIGSDFSVEQLAAAAPGRRHSDCCCWGDAEDCTWFSNSGTGSSCPVGKGLSLRVQRAPTHIRRFWDHSLYNARKY